MLVKEQGDGYLILVAHAEKMGMYLSHRVDLDEAEPDKLASMSMQPTGPPEMGGEIGEWANLSELLEQVYADAGVPAIAAAVVEDGKVTEVAVVGVRVVGGDDLATENDRFHVGSIGKSMTATMIGRLIEKGELDWDDTIGETLSDVDMRDAYRSVTLEQLLQHRSGVAAYTNFEDEELEERINSSGSPTEQRLAFVKEVLSSEPIAEPGATMTYSNAGYTVAALMAERATGEQWEALMVRELFVPTGMSTAEIGWPADYGDAMVGHVKNGDAYEVQSADYKLGAFLSPAGNICMSIGDLAIYAQAHLAGMAGTNGVVRAETVRELHALPDDSDDSGYACGWVIKANDGGTIHWHNGSAGTFFALAELYPNENRAIVVATNVGLEGAGVAELVSEQVNKRWKERSN